MQISNDVKARVFDIAESEKRKNTVTANISTYEGKDKDDKAVYSSWRANFVGDAFGKAKDLSEKDLIVLTNAKVESSFNKEKERLYVTVTVFDFEKAKDEK